MSVATDITGLQKDVARLQATIDRLGERINNQWRTVVDRKMPGEYLAELLCLPGLRGCWPVAGVTTGGDLYDASGQGRILTEHGNPVIGLYNGVAPYYEYDGTGDYHERADESSLDITGTETYIDGSIQGLTLLGWFWFDEWPGSSRGIMGKWNTSGNDRSYGLHLETAPAIQAAVSSDGTAETTVDSTITLALDTWYFLAMRFTPSTELALWVDDNKTTETSSIPASIDVNSSDFEIASKDGGSLFMTGRYSLGALYCVALPDRTIARLYNRGLPLFS